MLITCPICGRPTTRALCHPCANPRPEPSAFYRAIQKAYDETASEETPEHLKALLDRLN